jgi:hypothetical protein
MLQTHTPDSFEDARPHPSLESEMTRAAGTVLARDHLPLTAGAQDVQNPVEHRAVQHAWPTVGSGRLVGRQDGFDEFPQVIRDLAESIPLRRFLAHRMVLHDRTMYLSAPTNQEGEGF